MNRILTLCILSILVTSLHAIQSGQERFFIIIDAGSTGNRLHIHNYTWASPDSPLPTIWPSRNEKKKGGLSTFAANPNGAAEKMRDLLDWARTQLPDEEIRKSTPIHLQATAGLRSVTPQEAEAILNVVRDVFEESEFIFKRSWANIITGADEGINGWLATNYLLGAFEPSTDVQTHGVVEMGGASMQITFSPRGTISGKAKQHITNLVVADRGYYIYTYSFLNYGLQAAQKLYKQILIDEIEDGNPCYPVGYKMTSTGNFDLCLTKMTKVVDRSKQCDYESCSFNGIYQPVINEEPFLAIENFFYTSKFFKLDAGRLTEGDVTTTGNELVPLLKQAGRDYCDDPWAQIVRDHPHEDNSSLAYYCFAAAYEVAVLEHGFQFSEKCNIRPAKDIRGKGIEWELGATLRAIMQSDKHVSMVTSIQTDVNLKDDLFILSSGTCESLSCRFLSLVCIGGIIFAIWYFMIRSPRSPLNRGYKMLTANINPTSQSSFFSRV